VKFKKVKIFLWKRLIYNLKFYPHTIGHA